MAVQALALAGDLREAVSGLEAALDGYLVHALSRAPAGLA
jgi:hypothetical protein